jgi:hypothetical protein
VIKYEGLLLFIEKKKEQEQEMRKGKRGVACQVIA